MIASLYHGAVDSVWSPETAALALRGDIAPGHAATLLAICRLTWRHRPALRRDCLSAPLARHLLTLLPSLGQPDGDGLLAALHAAPFAAFTAPQRPMLPSAHSARHVATRAPAISPSASPSCHVDSSHVGTSESSRSEVQSTCRRKCGEFRRTIATR